MPSETQTSIAAKAPFNKIVWPFAFSQTISWAAMFYIFPAFLGVWERELGWSFTQISGALTLALVLSASFAPIAGRIIDRGYFVSLHAGGTFAGAMLLLALSRVSEIWQFYLVWALIGIAMSGALYQPCFAILTRTFDKRARAAITRVTLIAGFAGTLAFPLSHILENAIGWRMTIVAFAAGVLIISLPLAYYGASIAQSHARKLPQEDSEQFSLALAIVTRPVFWLLSISYFALAIDHSVILTHILPMLDDRGVTPANAIIAASFIGPMQVAGRLVMLAFENRVSTVAIAIWAFSALLFAALCLIWAGAWFGLIAIFVMLQGAGNGITSIVRPLLTAQLLGRKNFGVISGLLALPFIGGFAAGPVISALLWRGGGYDAVLMFAISICLLGIVTLLLAANQKKSVE